MYVLAYLQLNKYTSLCVHTNKHAALTSNPIVYLEWVCARARVSMFRNMAMSEKCARRLLIPSKCEIQSDVCRQVKTSIVCNDFSGWFDFVLTFCCSWRITLFKPIEHFERNPLWTLRSSKFRKNGVNSNESFFGIFDVAFLVGEELFGFRKDWALEMLFDWSDGVRRIIHSIQLQN